MRGAEINAVGLRSEEVLADFDIGKLIGALTVGSGPHRGLGLLVA